MKAIFAERKMLARRGEVSGGTLILIFKPEKVAETGYCVCRVEFRDDEKYNANISGADDFNALECAIAYVNSICENSANPEFLWEDGEPVRVGLGPAV